MTITTILGVCLAEKGFGLDELVVRMREMASKKAFPELLAEILMLVDENIRLSVADRRELPAKCACGCGRGDLVLDGTVSRKLRTSLGTIELKRLTRVKCRSCGKTFIPLLLLMGIESFQTKTSEFERIVLEACARARSSGASGTSRGTCTT